MYVCNAILNIGLPSTYSLMALESKGGYVCKHFVLTFFAKFSQPFLMEKRNKTMDKLKTDSLSNIYYAAIFKVLNQSNYL